MAFTFSDMGRDEIPIRIAAINAEIKARKRKSRYSLIAIAVVAAFGVLLIYGSSQVSANTPGAKEMAMFGIVLFLGSLLISGSVLFAAQVKESELEQELAVLDAKVRILAPHAPEPGAVAGNSSAYFDRLVDINLTNLSAYYGLVKIHASNGFLLATSAGGVGFSLLLLGLLLGYFGDPTKTKDISYLTAASGVLTEFIAGVFFYLYSKTVAQLKDYHDSLLAVQNVLLSFKLVGDTESPEQKAAMVSQLVQYLVRKDLDVPAQKTTGSQGSA